MQSEPAAWVPASRRTGIEITLASVAQGPYGAVGARLGLQPHQP
jgi:hypothetical protein